MGEADAGMQGNRRDGRRITDHRDHLPEVPRGGVLYEPRQKRHAEAPAAELRCRVDRVFDAPVVGRPRPVRGRIGKAGNETADLGD
jgi:hypothetical protein